MSAVVSGALGWKDIHGFGLKKIDWLRKFRPFENGVPVDDTIARIVRVIDPDEFNQAFISWANEIREATGQPHITLDGKTLLHSFDGKRTSALHSITAWNSTLGLVAAQLKSEGNKNENTSILDMHDMLNIEGVHITADAMNSPKKIVDKIIAKQADYTLCIKDNHLKFREEIKAYFHKVNRDNPELIAKTVEVDKGHGRIETRTCRQFRVNEWITQANKWKGIQTVIKMTREHYN